MASLAHHICYRSARQLQAYLPLESSRIEDLRKWLDLASRVLIPPIEVKCQPLQVGQMEAEWMVPKSPDGQIVGLFLHGGGYSIGSLQTHRGLVGRLAQLSGLSFLHIEYRLSPEHPFPAPLEDAVIAYQWLIHRGF
ncbi:MAG: alpha/beta hydrolase fold domain-containing protein, partial [Bacteroidota bacterium]